MVDRRIAVSGLIICGVAGGWFLHGFIAPRLVPVAAPALVEPVPSAKPSEPTETTASRRAAFDDVYKGAVWGTNAEGVGHSGFGSKLRPTLLYRTFLAQLLKDLAIHSVVDAGCGDWEFSQAIDWTGIDYKGYDIIPALVEQDTKKFGKPNIQFFAGDIVETELPPADLLISKNVLQHLPSADVQKFLAKQLHNYKFVLLTDGVSTDSLSSENTDIKPGEYRPIDLTRPPFNVIGSKVLTYWDGNNMQQVLFIAGKK